MHGRNIMGKGCLSRLPRSPAAITGAVVGLMVAGLAQAAPQQTLGFQQGDGGAFSETDATYIQAADSGIVPASDRNFGSAETLEVDDTRLSRGLIRFGDVFGPSPGQVPLGSTIHHATLELRVANNPSPNTFELHRVLTAWDESDVTLDNWGNGNGGEAGTDYATDASASFTDPSIGQLLSLDITADVSAWAAGAANHGFLLFAPSGNNAANFHSDDAATPANAPRLSITFTIPETGTFTLGAVGLLLLLARRGKQGSGLRHWPAGSAATQSSRS